MPFSSPLHLLPAVWPQSGRPLSTWDRPHLQDWQGKVSVLFYTVCSNALVQSFALLATLLSIQFPVMTLVTFLPWGCCLYAETLKFCFVNNLLLLLLSFEVDRSRDIAKVKMFSACCNSKKLASVAQRATLFHLI